MLQEYLQSFIQTNDLYKLVKHEPATGDGVISLKNVLDWNSCD